MGYYPDIKPINPHWSDLFASLDGQVSLDEVESLYTMMSTIESGSSDE